MSEDEEEDAKFEGIAEMAASRAAARVADLAVERAFEA